MVRDFRNNIEFVSKLKDAVHRQKGGTILALGISGSHAYGTSSEDSDVDWKGMYIAKTENLLGLNYPDDVFMLNEGDNEVTIFELRKTMSEVLKSNCTAVENFFGEQVVTSPEYLEAVKLVKPTLHKRGLYDTYRGMATFNFKKFIKKENANEARPTVKKYLYVFRALMAGTYVLMEGRIQQNIVTLNEQFAIPEVATLIDLKQNGHDDMFLKADQKEGVEKRIDALFVEIDNAYKLSPLSDEPDREDIAKVDKWLKNTRKKYLDHVN